MMSTNAIVREISAEHLLNPIGIGTPVPRISWKITAPARWNQTGWQMECDWGDKVEVATGHGDQQVLIDWPFAELASRQSVKIRVRVTGHDGKTTMWSSPLEIEAGLLANDDWTAKPVGLSWSEEADTERRPGLVRKGFHLVGAIRKARLYASAHGLCEVEINGKKVGDHELVPGWTKYDERLLYWTYDVTAMLNEGPNAIGAWLADGWYRGRLGFRGGYRDLYGTDQAFIGQLEVELENGEIIHVVTDKSWKTHLSPILLSGLYDGETYDCREEPVGWALPNFDDTDWADVAVFGQDTQNLEAAMLPPIRVTEEINPQTISRLGKNKFMVDFGQNLVGRLQLQVNGNEGDEVEIKHAEVLVDGELATRPLRLAKAIDRVILDGNGPRVFEPRFTFHGFRYATVEGPSELEASDLKAKVLHSDMERTGYLTTSNADLNRLHENVVWGMRSNFISIPTDCPQRDERLGWTGDIQVFAPTASYLYNCYSFLRNWFADVRLEQLEDGTIPWFVPTVPGGPTWTPIRTGAVWGDVAVLTPMVLHERFGDIQIIAEQFDSAKAWVDRMILQSGPERLWRKGHQLGDWLDPAAPPHAPAEGKTDKFLVAQAYFSFSTRKFAEMALLLGHNQIAEEYRRVADEARDAFREAYCTENGRLTSDGQTAYALAICFGLLTKDEQELAGLRLVELVRNAHNKIATGFAGTPLILDALTKTGHLETAYDMLLEDECPSWLYAVRMGATTVWERWDSMLPDGTVNPGEMTSFNHYALGAVADWMHRVIAGISLASPGYREILWEPQPGGGLTSAGFIFKSDYGEIVGSWNQTDSETLYELTVPIGVTAKVRLQGDPQEYFVRAGETFSQSR